MNLPETKTLETELVGSLLVKPDNYFYAADVLTANDFVTPAGRAAFVAVGDLLRKGQEINPVSVSMEAGKDTFPYLLAAEDIPGVGAQGRMIADRFATEAQRRRLARELTVMAGELKDTDPEIILSNVRALYNNEITRQAEDGKITDVVERYRRMRQHNIHNGRIGIDTGIHDFDKHWITYQPGHLWVIGGWTSSGKTALATELMSRLMGSPASIAFFSTEMTEEQVIGRLAANISGIGFHQAMAIGGAAIQEKVDAACAQIAAQPLRVFDKIRDMGRLENQCRKIKMEAGLDVVFVDFVQNLRKQGVAGKYEMASEIALDIQALAQELRCCIVALSQIPNDEGKQDSGILVYKGAGEIAAAADVGMLIKRAKHPENALEVQVRKNRHGALTKFYLHFSANWSQLKEAT